MSYKETTTHRWWAETAAEKQNPFRPRQGLAAPDLFIDTRDGNGSGLDQVEQLPTRQERGYG
jgi:hypothetical protein